MSHLAEFIPPLGATFVYLVFYRGRAMTLAREGRPVPRWRVVSFVSGVVFVAVVQLPPLDGLADTLLVAHMVQHIVIGDVASLLIVLGLTGPVLAPLLRTRASRALRRLSHPLVALALWAIDLYAWHLPFFYQLAIEHDVVHALEHACLLWFGTLLWLALIGPLPKPAWFVGWWGVGYVMLVRLVGAVLANALIWGQTVFYPVYRASDAARGLSPLSDQNLAGGVMMVEQVVLTTVLLAWLLARLLRQDEERQALLDLARKEGVSLSEERAARAVRAGATSRLRERVAAEQQAHALHSNPASARRLESRESEQHGERA